MLAIDVLNIGIFRKSASSTFYSWMIGFFMVLLFPFQFCGRVIVLKKKDFPKYADVDNTMKTVFYACEWVRVKLCRIFDLCGNCVLKLQVFFAFFCINYSHFCLDLCAIVCAAFFIHLNWLLSLHKQKSTMKRECTLTTIRGNNKIDKYLFWRQDSNKSRRARTHFWHGSTVVNYNA